ncbi:MAG TPA: hypothetical protein VGQ57_20495 [Polyangiaceae bacterium]|jgi:hypothetical protein|nr:hypothetical protein [Polyangiaceae bacterium]
MPRPRLASLFALLGGFAGCAKVREAPLVPPGPPVPLALRARPAGSPVTIVGLPPAPPPLVDCALASEPQMDRMKSQDPDLLYSPLPLDENSPKHAGCAALAKQKPYAGAELDCLEARTSKADELWAIAVQPPRDEDAYAAWQLVYSRGKKTVTSSWHEAALERCDPAVQGCNAPSGPLPLALVDYDGDGQAELVTAVQAWSDVSGHSFTTVEIWRASAEKIALLAGTEKRRFIDVVDRNADGRPELLEDAYDVMLGGSFGWVRSKTLWSMLVEVGPTGKLIDDGELSRAFSLEQCPDVPDPFAGLPGEDASCVAGYVHCASLRQVPASTVEKALDAYCALPAGESQQWCPDSRATWLTMASVRHPFVLATKGRP